MNTEIHAHRVTAIAYDKNVGGWMDIRFTTQPTVMSENGLVRAIINYEVTIYGDAILGDGHTGSGVMLGSPEEITALKNDLCIQRLGTISVGTDAPEIDWVSQDYPAAPNGDYPAHRRVRLEERVTGRVLLNLCAI